jgi:hypothetical protein
MDARRTTAILGGLIALGAGVIFFAHTHKTETTPPPPFPAPTVHGLVKPTPVPTPTIPDSTPAMNEPSNEATPPAPSTAWEDRIDQALRSNVSDAQTAQILIGMLPTFPEEGQIDAAEHITNLVTDDQYASVLPLVTNPRLPETVLGVFVTDLMNRDDPVKLRTLLKVAQIPDHPFREEALADLQIYVDADYETNWQKWSSAVETYLASHPREP